jgi:hypothetical protein
MLPAGFQPAIPWSKIPQTHTLDGAAITIGRGCHRTESQAILFSHVWYSYWLFLNGQADLSQAVASLRRGEHSGRLGLRAWGAPHIDVLTKVP